VARPGWQPVAAVVAEELPSAGVVLEAAATREHAAFAGQLASPAVAASPTGAFSDRIEPDALPSNGQDGLPSARRP